MKTWDNISPVASDLLSFIAENGYICPWGGVWDKLWEMLPDKKQIGNGWEPSLPLILTGWYMSSNLEKSLRMMDHIEWADRHGAIDKIDKYLRGLDPELWHRWKDSPYVNGG